MLTVKNIPKLSLLKSITNINYIKLQTIKINKCKINNIESLIGISAPNLINLYLDQNYIFNVSCLRKATFKIRNLDMTNNPLI